MTTTQKPEMTDAFVLGGVRTPFARYGSSLSHIRVDDLLGMAMKGACERVGVSLDQIEDIIAGCVNPAHEGMGDIARWSALAAGFPDSVAGSTINRFCASSLSATINVAHAGGSRRASPSGVAGAECVHQHDRDRPERGRPVRVSPRRDRRVRTAFAATRQGCP